MSQDLGKRIRTALLGVLREEGLLPDPKPAPRVLEGPRVLFVVHGGSPCQEEAFTQIEALDKSAAKSSIYLPDASRICLEDKEVKEATGSKCLFSNVSLDARERVLKKADWLVLPTLPLAQALRAANLGGAEPCLIMDALLAGKKVLAANDAFRHPGVVLKPGLEKRIEEVFKTLAGYGVILSPLARLAQTFKDAAERPSAERPAADRPAPAGPQNPKPDSPAGEALTYIAARDVRAALDAGRKTVRLARNGLVSPLAHDLAKEGGLGIEKETG